MTLRHPSDLDDPQVLEELAHPIAGAETAWADVAALQRDFGHLPDAPATDEGWYLWLAQQGGLVSATQAAQQVANSKIPVRDATVTVYRLPRGGRAFSAPVRSVASDYLEPIDGGGLLSLKAVGVKPGVVPQANLFNYSNGLQWLEGVLEEVLTQRIVERVLHHAGSEVRCLPVYGALYGAFELYDGEGGSWPSGILARQAHRRPEKGSDHPAFGSRGQQLLLDTELELRRYGITSTSGAGTYRLLRREDGELEFQCAHLGGFIRGESPPAVSQDLWERYRAYADPDEGLVRFQGVATQFTRFEDGVEPLLLDFGGYRITEGFSDPLLSMVLGRSSHWGGTITPDSEAFVQPDPELAFDVNLWQARPLEELNSADLNRTLGDLQHRVPGPPEDLPYSPIEHAVYRLSHGFTAGLLGTDEIATTLDHLLELTTEHLA